MNPNEHAPAPPGLARNVLALCGDEGKQWLRELPQIIGEFEKLWSIETGPAFTNGEYNFVAPARGTDGTPLVLKIAPPRGDGDCYSEAKYLRTRNGTGAVRLFAEDRDQRALLLERAVPGKSLTSDFDSNKPAAVAPAIELLLRVPRDAPDDLTDVILLDDWFDGMRRHASTAFPHDYGEKALEIYERLSTRDDGRTGYLHGDFHPDNIVSAERWPHLLIDPKGMIGHIGYDIGVFLNNLHWWQETEDDVVERLRISIRQFSEAFGISEKELREWAFAQMVLGAWWTFDEMPDLYDNEVAKADIWGV